MHILRNTYFSNVKLFGISKMSQKLCQMSAWSQISTKWVSFEELSLDKPTRPYLLQIPPL